MAEDAATPYSGVTIVIFIACGILTFVLLFLFAKREIMRFSLKNRRGPHVAIGHDAPKHLRREMDDRFCRIIALKLEARSLLVEKSFSGEPNVEDQRPTSTWYRMKAVDDVKIFEEKIREKYPSMKRKPLESLRSYLLTVLSGSSPGSKKVKLVHNLCDAFEHARHNPKEFGSDDYQYLSMILSELQQ